MRTSVALFAGSLLLLTGCAVARDSAPGVESAGGETNEYYPSNSGNYYGDEPVIYDAVREDDDEDDLAAEDRQGYEADVDDRLLIASREDDDDDDEHRAGERDADGDDDLDVDDREYAIFGEDEEDGGDDVDAAVRDREGAVDEAEEDDADDLSFDMVDHELRLADEYELDVGEDSRPELSHLSRPVESLTAVQNTTDDPSAPQERPYAPKPTSAKERATRAPCNPELKQRAISRAREHRRLVEKRRAAEKRKAATAKALVDARKKARVSRRELNDATNALRKAAMECQRKACREKAIRSATLASRRTAAVCERRRGGGRGDTRGGNRSGPGGRGGRHGGKPPPQKCTACAPDGSCAAGRSCRNGVCVNVKRLDESCASRCCACGKGLKCVAKPGRGKVCCGGAPKPSKCEKCAPGGSCPPGKSCRSGVCVVVKGVDESCGSECCACEKGLKCVDEAGKGKVCSSLPKPSPEGYKAPPPTCEACAPDGSCTSGKSCLNGACMNVKGLNESCGSGCCACEKGLSCIEKPGKGKVCCAGKD